MAGYKLIPKVMTNLPGDPAIKHEAAQLLVTYAERGGGPLHEHTRQEKIVALLGPKATAQHAHLVHAALAEDAPGIYAWARQQAGKR